MNKKSLFNVCMILLLTTAAVVLLQGCGNGSGSQSLFRSRSNQGEEKAIQKATLELDESNYVYQYPRIANLWGLISNPDFFILVNSYDLAIPYSYKNQPLIVLENVDQDENTRILFTQYSTKGRPDLDDQINEWWNVAPGSEGYACLLRDSAGNILLTEGWNQPKVNMINTYCREAVLQKNVTNFLSAVNTAGTDLLYDGLYWDMFYGRISWLADDIDSDLDGVPDEPDVLDASYNAAMVDFLQKIRTQLPGAILVGNESPIDFAPYMNGRVFEWQLQSYSDGLELNTWDEILDDYIDWSNQSVEPSMTILMDAPEEVLIEKYGFDNLDKMPQALMQETAASYQRMRFGLTSALMGNGLYSFDFGKMIHGQYWWYDEYGHVASGSQQNAATLPAPGYLGKPLEEAAVMSSSNLRRIAENNAGLVSWLRVVMADQAFLFGEMQPDFSSLLWVFDGGGGGGGGGGVITNDTDVWGRRFEHGIVLVNPNATKAFTVQLGATYCKLNGQQAPLYQIRVDDDDAQADGTWQVLEASFDQFGDTVHSAPAGTNYRLTYTPSILYQGTYEVFAWISPSAGQSTQALFTINHAGGESSVTIDESAGSVGWQSLGEFAFDEGDEGSVTLSSSPDGTVIGDALKWVSKERYNDGSEVSSVIVQPEDGIILVDCDINP